MEEFSSDMRTKLLSTIVEARTKPTQSMLTEAPLLRDWVAAFDPNGTLCLSGVICNHPSLGDGKKICTSQLLALDSEGNWARTLSRWYRLQGQQNIDVEADIRSRRFTLVDRASAAILAAEIREALWHKCDGHFRH